MLEREECCDLEREAVVRLVPLPPLPQLPVAIFPQPHPVLPPEAAVLRRGLVEAGAASTVGLHLAGELDQALHHHWNFTVASIPASGLNRGNKLPNYKGARCEAGEKHFHVFGSFYSCWEKWGIFGNLKIVEVRRTLPEALFDWLSEA